MKLTQFLGALLTIALAVKLEQDGALAAVSPTDADRRALERADEVLERLDLIDEEADEDDEEAAEMAAERLLLEGSERRGERDGDEARLLRRPVGEIVAMICRDLGVPFDAALWWDGPPTASDPAPRREPLALVAPLPALADVAERRALPAPRRPGALDSS